MSSKTKTSTKKSKDIPIQSPQESIIIHGARMHNLKNVTVSIPRNQLVVVTGVSGSGKSSLTMDTLFAEGQRKYAESLSSYARQFLGRRDKPDVDFIKGLCPAIAIEQKVSTKNSRSTVGSMTEILDYIRLLYARIGKTYSPISGQLVKKDSVSDVVDFIQNLKAQSKVHILIPFTIHSDRKAEEELDLLLQKGFSRIYIPNYDSENSRNNTIRIEDVINQKNFSQYSGDIYVLIDRIVVKEQFEEEDLHRLADSIQTAFYESEGSCYLEVQDADQAATLHNFNNRFEADGMEFEEPTPHLFSFNSPIGACPKCEGFGQVLGISETLVIPNDRLSVYEGAVACWSGDKMSAWKKDFIHREGLKGFPIHKAIKDLDKAQYAILWSWIQDFFKMVEENLYKIQYRVLQARYRGKTRCMYCGGSRLRPEALYVKVGDKDISEISSMPIDELYKWLQDLQLSTNDAAIAKRILLEIHQRLSTLLDVGLSYLHLDRLANTLSGGESQRIQLTKFLGSNLTNSLYILDEPSIGLHPRDTARLIQVLKNLRDLHNTVIVVEHDEMMMQEADYIIDMGPLAAHLGGEVIATGDYHAILSNPKSLTGKYLSHELEVGVDKSQYYLGQAQKEWVRLTGCREHNLKDISVDFPLHQLCVVTGVSGSGKTTLVKQTLYPALQQHLGLPIKEQAGAHSGLSGDFNTLTSVELVDQNPIGKSSRSNPVTYIKAYDDIRNLFSKQHLSQIRGFEPKHFSFNVDGGRCDTCKGEGEVIVEMQFLADVHLVCETCKGKRFKDEILEVTYHDKNIYDVLEMSVDEAIEFFKDEKSIYQKLMPLSEVGLGYIKLGQSSNTLSGGESQRVKLASFLGKGSSKDKILFIFDEPTTGLHFHDINKLLRSFFALIEQGHSIIVIEHNVDIIKNADWIIDIGPEGGVNGGQVVYTGKVESLKKVKESYTARYI